MRFPGFLFCFCFCFFNFLLLSFDGFLRQLSKARNIEVASRARKLLALLGVTDTSELKSDNGIRILSIDGGWHFEIKFLYLEEENYHC